MILRLESRLESVRVLDNLCGEVLGLLVAPLVGMSVNERTLAVLLARRAGEIAASVTEAEQKPIGYLTAVVSPTADVVYTAPGLVTWWQEVLVEPGAEKVDPRVSAFVEGSAPELRALRAAQVGDAAKAVQGSRSRPRRRARRLGGTGSSGS